MGSRVKLSMNYWIVPSPPPVFLEFVQLLNKEWECLSRVFADLTKDAVLFHLNYINEHGRPDAHGKDVSREQVK